MGRVCSTYGDKKNGCRELVGKPERKRPLGRARGGWEDSNNKIDLREIEGGGMESINLAQDKGQ
jgi:hypothetical protein